jgi:hypothetical protein
MSIVSKCLLTHVVIIIMTIVTQMEVNNVQIQLHD